MRRRCGPGCRCCCCCSPPMTIIRSSGCSASSATTASWRSCVALQIVSNAWKWSASAAVAVAVEHRRLQHVADLQRLRHQHRRLVGEADAAAGRDRGRSPARRRLPKRARNASRSPPPADVVADDGRFAVVEDHEVAPAVLDRLGGRGLRLLVPDLAVDDRRVPALGVAPDVLPDVQHRPAGGVDERAAAPLELLQHGDRDAERRQDHDVVRPSRSIDCAGVSLRNPMPIARSWSLTCGLWMISPVRKTARSGKRWRV